MPNWVRNGLYAFALLLLLARWRQVAAFMAGIGGWFKGMGRDVTSDTSDPLIRFLMFGILAVMVTVMWAIYWRNRPEKKP